jgi:hypothetical protein
MQAKRTIHPLHPLHPLRPRRRAAARWPSRPGAAPRSRHAGLRSCCALALTFTFLAAAIAPAQLQNPPADAKPVPADYDGDGFTDIGLKGSNGIWYIDVGRNGFGGRWDYAYPGYGGTTVVPVPADYDGDGKADLAAKDANGQWGIDYAANNFGVWDVLVLGYGNASAVPVPADYDGDRKADLAVKDATGAWLIDYASNGFVGWDVVFGGYGGSTAIPVPADYDGDRRADLSVKDPNGFWHIDYARDGFGSWNEIRGGYGNAAAVPVPADYDNDRWADLSVKDGNGFWLIDFARDGFGTWNASYSGRGGGWSIATPGDYDRDGRLDLSVKDTSGFWLIDFAVDGYAAWNLQIDNVNRQNVDRNAPWIESTEIFGPNGKITPVNGHFPVSIGVTYVAAMRINPGNGQYSAGLEINPDLHVPASLNVVNRVGSTSHIRITARHTRRYAFTPSQPGSLPLGFMMRDVVPPVGTGNAFNPDFGVRVLCTARQTGIYGTVTVRVQSSSGRFVAGPPIVGAMVAAGNVRTTSAADGTWRLPVTGAGHRVTVSAAGFSDTVAVNVSVPAGSGVQVDTPLEEDFRTPGPSGMRYTTYVDYSRGRTILHTVRVAAQSATVRLEKSSPSDTPPFFTRLTQIAATKLSFAMINAGWWDDKPPAPHTRCLGYLFSHGYKASVVNPYDTFYVRDDRPDTPLELDPPMLTIKTPIFADIAGQHVLSMQQIDIVTSEADFLSTVSTQWGRDATNAPIWDNAPRDGISDVEYAWQCAPFLLKNDAVIWRGVHDDLKTWEYLWAVARTAVGVAPGGVVFLVVADGEGVNGGQGASQNQLGEFFRDVLRATMAMGLDGGLSSEMVLRGRNGPRIVNTITGEDSSWDIDPYVQIIQERDGGPGSVFGYLHVGS